MNGRTSADRQSRALAARLRRHHGGEVHADRITRGMYATDASIYQVFPLLVAMPRDTADIAAALELARAEGVPVTPRGAGTSQAGQAIGPGLVLDVSRHLHGITHVDRASRTARVQPGLVLDTLNRALRPEGLFFPVDVSTASRATLGGMAGNNSAGARSIVYGHMVENVRALHAVLPDGTTGVFRTRRGGEAGSAGAADRVRGRIAALRARESGELERRLPAVARHVAGYALHRVEPDGRGLGDVLVGSEGTLAFFTELELALAPLPAHRVLGVCRFPSLASALSSVPALLELGPSAVELVDGTVVERAWALPLFRATVERLARNGSPALLFVEFAGAERDRVLRRLDALAELLADRGLPGAMVRAETPDFQESIWALRRAGMNLVTATRDDRKPVSFLEDCAVPVERLADYAERVTAIFDREGLAGTWYAHASVGCLHVRPALDLKQPEDRTRMRRVAESILDVVRDLGGSHSGEHGDGRLRSEFLAPMLGTRLTDAFREIKRTFDPRGLLNPGVIVDAPAMDAPELLRFGSGYGELPVHTGLEWGEWGSFQRATEACNNNGACRKRAPGVMCPSYRVTGNECDVTRGRANTLRLALSGQLGGDALTDDEVARTLALCVGCKACRQECPAGVDVARMKVEVLHQRRLAGKLPVRARLFGHLPRAASWLGQAPRLAAAATRSRLLTGLLERAVGIARLDAFPHWAARPWSERELGPGRAGADGREVLLFVDTFTRWFEPENARAATRVLRRAGYEVRAVERPQGERPLCCGRTYLSVGMVEEARVEARRFLQALAEAAARSVPVVGLEPSCVLTMRDEWPALVGAHDAGAVPARLIDEFLVQERDAGRLTLPLSTAPARGVRVHAHCHQKAFGLEPATLDLLRLVPDLRVERLATGCCGMAGSFGHEREHVDVSRAMAGLELVPLLDGLGEGERVVANGTSCRHQIRDVTGREALHVIRVLDEASGG
ncbi:MAG: FAD-linked oxidase C-terminal domain-containing protein [Gemmatimonadota bacterium]